MKTTHMGGDGGARAARVETKLSGVDMRCRVGSRDINGEFLVEGLLMIKCTPSVPNYKSF